MYLRSDEKGVAVSRILVRFRVCTDRTLDRLHVDRVPAASESSPEVHSRGRSSSNGVGRVRNRNSRSCSSSRRRAWHAGSNGEALRRATAQLTGRFVQDLDHCDDVTARQRSSSARRQKSTRPSVWSTAGRRQKADRSNSAPHEISTQLGHAQNRVMHPLVRASWLIHRSHELDAPEVTGARTVAVSLPPCRSCLLQDDPLGDAASGLDRAHRERRIAAHLTGDEGIVLEHNLEDARRESRG